MSQHPRDLTRDEQISDALAICEGLRAQGWGKAVIRLTTRGTLEVTAEAEASKVEPRHQWTTGRTK